MKKIYLFLVLIMFSFSCKLYAGAGVYEGWMTIGSTTYNFGSSTVPLNGANLGVFMVGNNHNITLTEASVWKDGSGNICGSEVFYKISGTGSTSYTGETKGTGSMGYHSHLGGNNHKWQKTTTFTNQDILIGLVAGTYQIEFWIKSTGSTSNTSSCTDDLYLNNGGANYKATFTVNEPSTITTSPITGTTLCAGASVNIPYTATGTFGAGNIFTAHLSNAAGSFATPNPVGNLSSNTSGTISATIPVTTAHGTGYRIRVVSSNPAVNGSDNGTNLIINPAISSAILHFPKTATVCDNAAFTAYGRIGITGVTNNDATPSPLITLAKFGYGTSPDPTTWTNWSDANFGVQGPESPDGTKDEYSYTIPANTLTAGLTYYYGFKFKVGDCAEVLAGQNGIFSNDPGVLTVLNATKITTQPTSQAVDLYSLTTLSVAATANASGPLTYQWYSNPANSYAGSTELTNETNSTYNPDTYLSGTKYYYVIVKTGNGTCDTAVSSIAGITVKTAADSGTANWANVQSPKTDVVDIYEGVGVDIFAQVYVQGATPGTTVASGVSAWIGYSSNPTDSHPSTWPSINWFPAAHNPGQSFMLENNDEYMILGFGKGLPIGSYFVASRFQKDGGPFIYGGVDGIDTPESGGVWNGGTYHSLKINIDKTITWNGTSWNNTVGPSNYFPWAPAIIAGDTASPGNFSAKNLTINSGIGLTIPTGNYVKVQDAIINNNAGNDKLIIESDANLVQINETDTNSGTGGATVKRNSGVPNNQYNYWSSPVAAQSLYAFYDGGTVPANEVMTYNTWDDYFTVASSGNFEKGKGYSVKGSSAGSSNAAFKGILHNGEFSKSLATSGQKYNLVGNPFPSNINLSQLYTDNSSNIESTVYFWDYTNNTVLNQVGGNYTTLYTSHNYADINLPSETGNTAPNGTKPPSNIAKVGQGFIVKAKTSTLNFKNSHRTELGTGNSFFGKTQSGEMNRYWLKMTTPVNLFNTLAVVYLEGADQSFNQYDSEIIAETSDNIFSFADNTKVSINGRSVFQNTDVVKLGTSHFENGNYTISIDRKEGVFANGQAIYLKDKALGIITNLQEGAYVFDTQNGNYDNRFEIVYQPEITLATDGATKEEVQVYRNGDHFVVKSSQSKINNVEVYDASGRLQLNVNATSKEVKLQTSTLLNGMYILKINTEKGIVTKKILR